MLVKQLASSSVLSICFDFRIAVQHLPSPFSAASSGFLTAETLPRQHVGTNYTIGVRQSAGHCVVLNSFNILSTPEAEWSKVSLLCRAT